MSLTLVIGNKNYSSWSMRPWVLMKAHTIAFDEQMLKFHTAEWKQQINQVSPSGLVPVLWNGSAPEGEATWDSIAIFERLAELFPQRSIWPKDSAARNHARCVVAEMHSGFRALREAMPMNIRASLPGLGVNEASTRDIARIEKLWGEARVRFGERTGAPFLYGEFSAADAMFAPVVMRFRTHQPTLGARTREYCQAVEHSPAVKQWIDDALKETEFVAADEPYAVNVKSTATE